MADTDKSDHGRGASTPNGGEPSTPDDGDESTTEDDQPPTANDDGRTPDRDAVGPDAAGPDATGGTGRGALGLSRRGFLRTGAAATAGGLALGTGGTVAGQSTVRETCNSNASYRVGDAEVINNDWSTTTGTQCVFVNDDGSYGWHWDRPSTGACPDDCPNYPEVMMGTKPWSGDSGAPGFPVQVDDIDEILVDIDIDNGATGQEWNVALEWWFTPSRPPSGNPSHEVMVLLEWADGHDKGELVEEAAATDRFGNQYDLWEHVTGRVEWSFYIFRVAGNSMPNNLDLTVLYDYLFEIDGTRKHGYQHDIPRDHWMTGIEIGNETWDHSSGRTTVHNFDTKVNGQVATTGTDSSFDLEPVDEQAPTAPSGLTLFSTTQSSAELSWNAASDADTGVDHYVVYVDGSADHEVPAGTTSTTVEGLQAGTSYAASVTAVDGMGNESPESDGVTILTNGAGGGEEPPTWPDGTDPGDPDGDDVWEDLNGNGRVDTDDVVVYFENYDEPHMADNAAAYDINGNGRTDSDDVVRLFQSL